MNHTLPDFICQQVFVLLVCLIFCLSDFINNCKSKVDIFSNSISAVHHHQISSPDSPGSKSPSFRNHA